MNMYPFHKASYVYADEVSQEDWEKALDQFEREIRDPSTHQTVEAWYAEAKEQLFTLDLGEIHRDPTSQSPLPLTEDETL